MKTAATLAVAAGLLAATATAQYTTVRAPSGSELSHAEILGNALGQSFTSTGNRGRDLTSGSIFADRISDSVDQLWTGGFARATIIGKQAGYSHTFGFVQNGVFNGLLDTDDIGASTSVRHIDGKFEWALQVDEKNGGDLWRSKNSRNSDHKDHMVTYALYENNSLTGYVLFFEDLPSWCSDKDFNDAGVLLTIVPTPHAAGLALAGLGGFGLTAARRRRS